MTVLPAGVPDLGHLSGILAPRGANRHVEIARGHGSIVRAAGPGAAHCTHYGLRAPGGKRHLELHERPKREARLRNLRPRSVLARLAHIPIGTWSFKTEKRSVRHMGPMAQDFRRAFGLGADERRRRPTPRRSGSTSPSRRRVGQARKSAHASRKPVHVREPSGRVVTSRYRPGLLRLESYGDASAARRGALRARRRCRRSRSAERIGRGVQTGARDATGAPSGAPVVHRVRGENPARRYAGRPVRSG